MDKDSMVKYEEMRFHHDQWYIIPNKDWKITVPQNWPLTLSFAS